MNPSLVEVKAICRAYWIWLKWNLIRENKVNKFLIINNINIVFPEIKFLDSINWIIYLNRNWMKKILFNLFNKFYIHFYYIYKVLLIFEVMLNG